MNYFFSIGEGGRIDGCFQAGDDTKHLALPGYIAGGEDVFNDMWNHKYEGGEWVFDARPLPPEPETAGQQIADLKQQLAAATDANLTTMSALADVFEQVLSLQDQLAALQGTE